MELGLQALERSSFQGQGQESLFESALEAVLSECFLHTRRQRVPPIHPDLEPKVRVRLRTVDSGASRGGRGARWHAYFARGG